MGYFYCNYRVSMQKGTKTKNINLILLAKQDNMRNSEIKGFLTASAM